jgi:hypothetical protein
MAGPQGGLTASIRRKLQQGRTPEEIVQELAAGGLGQVSAQRFVDRALAEDASASPLPAPDASITDASVSSASAPVDSLDQFIQTKSAETELENAKTGSKSLWFASMLMCSGVAITGMSYIMADPGERYTLMWGPVAFGALLWGRSVIQGFSNARSFAWFSAIGSIAAPAVLAAILFGVAIAYEPTEEELQRTELADSSEDGAGR